MRCTPGLSSIGTRPSSALGYPTTDEHPIWWFGVANDFEHGSSEFYWWLWLLFLDPVVVR